MNDKQTEPTRREHLFIVRMWQEVDQISVSEWRGNIEHIPTKKHLNFTALIDLHDFIVWRLNEKSKQ